MARAAAAKGWAVCLTYNDDATAAAAVVGEIEAAGGVATAVRADIAVEADVLGAFAAAEAMGPLTALVANAGIAGTKTRVDELTVERVERILAVNVLGTIVCCREAVRRLSTGTAGRAARSCSSRRPRPGSAAPTSTSTTPPRRAPSTRSASGWRRRWPTEGVRVNVVRPGMIDTEIHARGGQPNRIEQMLPLLPMGRAGEAAEIADAVVWLLGDEASYCTGSILDVTGGR